MFSDDLRADLQECNNEWHTTQRLGGVLQELFKCLKDFPQWADWELSQPIRTAMNNCLKVTRVEKAGENTRKIDYSSSHGQNQHSPHPPDLFETFVQENYNIDINSLVSKRQKEQDAAKKLPGDIASCERAVKMLKRRDVAISALASATSLPGELHPDDDLLPSLFATINSTCSETKEKLLEMQQKLEDLKKLQKMLQDNSGVGANRLTCAICTEFMEEVMAAECGHPCCSGCSAKMSTCYVCKKRANWKRIFL